MAAFSQFVLAVSAIAGTLAAPAPEPIGPELPDFEIGGANLARRQDYTQNYKTGGNVNFQFASDGYSVTFSGAGDFVVGKAGVRGRLGNEAFHSFISHLASLHALVNISFRNITFSGTTTSSAGTVLRLGNDTRYRVSIRINTCIVRYQYVSIHIDFKRANPCLYTRIYSFSTRGLSHTISSSNTLSKGLRTTIT
jgi:hypothetical protein